MAELSAGATVQIHLTRQCNLACAHCYSRSGPRVSERLDFAQLKIFIEDARDEGYRTVAFSGGEPFLYPEFEAALDHVHHLDMRAIAVTNATVLTDARASSLAKLDFVAVSVDGPEPIHNAVRRSPSAFSRMLGGLDVIKRASVPFGIAHTVTRDSLPHLSWMADFALDRGAAVLQLHPLGLVGFAEDALPGLDGEALSRLYLAAAALAVDHADRLGIHVDLFNRERLRVDPGLVVQTVKDSDRGEPLASIVSPLVLMSNGDISPICYDMGARYRLGNIADGPLALLATRFRSRGLPALADLCATVLARVLGDDDGWPYLNWFEMLELESRASA